jgi:hypothetical protein
MERHGTPDIHRFGWATGVAAAGVINGGPTGVDAASCSISTLSNLGVISGGVAATSKTSGAGTALGAGSTFGGAGGAGVENDQFATIGSRQVPGSGINNSGSMFGGAGGSGFPFGGAGGTGVLNSGTITTLTNSGIAAIISGGQGGLGSHGASGGAGVKNNGTITTLSNLGIIGGGRGGTGTKGGQGGFGVENGGMVTTLTNSGTINGGGAGAGGANGNGTAGAGVATSGTILTLVNSGKISGSIGVFVTFNGTISTLDNQAGGVISGTRLYGLQNFGGTIGTLINNGTIDSGAGAILSTGTIGPITNTGQIIGNVRMDQTSVSITGGSGKTFGVFKGGTITVGGDLTFAGNTELADNVVVRDGVGTVINLGVLRLAAPEIIDGNFTQTEPGTAPGVLDFLLAGDLFGQYGSLTVTKIATLGGELALTSVPGFHLAAGDTFDLMTFGEDPGSFTGVSLDGAACSGGLSDVWLCPAGFKLDVDLTASGLEVTAQSVPEPSTWALLVTGFLSLARLGLRRRRRASAP